MKKQFKRANILLILITLFSCVSEEDDFRKHLEERWNDYTVTFKNGDIASLPNVLSSYTLNTLKNGTLSNGNNLTVESIKALSPHQPNIKDLEYISIYREGKTAALAYFRGPNHQISVSEGAVYLLYIRFVNENNLWKIDMSNMRYQELDEYKSNPIQFDLSLIKPEYRPNGIVREPPKLLDKAEIVGLIDIGSLGYETRVTVNDTHHGFVTDNASSGIIMGGLKEGENFLNIEYKRLSMSDSNPPSVTIRVQDHDGSLKTIYNFHNSSNGDYTAIKSFLVSRDNITNQ